MPLSTQWDKAGYYYPTQIAQYGLSHWSKYAGLVSAASSLEGSVSPITRTVYENGVEDILGNWHGDTTRVTSQVTSETQTQSVCRYLIASVSVSH